MTGGFVLAFHDISSAQFTDFIESLEGFQPVPLDELLDRMERSKPTGGLFSITVDDGVGANVRAIGGVLHQRQWPGTFYLPTAYLDSGVPMAFQWWSNLVPALPRRPIRVGKELFDLSRTDGLRRLTRQLETLWRTRRPEVYLPLLDGFLEFMEKEQGIPRSRFQPPPPIAWDEVRQLGSSELISFESHGTAHVAVSAMSEAELANEMLESRDRIAAHTGRPCRHFCYPFGGPESIGTLAPRVARRFYDSAVTMNLGGVDGADRWQLPRIPIYPTNSRAFAQLKIGLKCGRLPQLRTSRAGESAA